MDNGLKQCRAILSCLGKVRWSKLEGTFVIENAAGAVLKVCPNSDEDIKAGLHVDEIAVAKSRRGKGAAGEMMTGLCRLADEHQLTIYGGPIGWSTDPWSERFVAWLSGRGFEPDPFPPTKVHDKTAFYARRLPRPLRKHAPSP